MVISAQVPRSRKSSSFAWLPLLLLSWLAFNIIAFFFGDATNPEAVWNNNLASVMMISGVVWKFTWGDLLIALTLVLLFFELIRATDTGASAIANHGVSLALLIASLVEFLLWPSAATSVFFLIMVVMAIDVIAGFTITIVGARRDFTAPGM